MRTTERNTTDTPLHAVPDDTGTPERVSSAVEKYEAPQAAELVEEGAELVRAYSRLHNRETETIRSLARVIVRLRGCYLNADGRPDYTGTTYEYKEAVQALYRKAGVPSDARSTLQSAVRWHISTQLRKHLREQGYTDDDLKYYKLLKADKATRHKQNERNKTRDARQTREAAATAEVDVSATAEGYRQPDLRELLGTTDAEKEHDPRDVAKKLTDVLNAFGDIVSTRRAMESLVRLKKDDREALRAVLAQTDEATAVVRSYL